MAKRATGMQLVDGQSARGDGAWLYQTVERLTRQAGLPIETPGTAALVWSVTIPEIAPRSV